MMDCSTAQQIVSAALDREPIDPETLVEAKDHCRRCEECSGFIRTLVALKSAGTIAPAPDLPDRIMSRIRAEIAAEAAASTTESVATSGPQTETVPQAEPAAFDAARFLAALEAEPVPPTGASPGSSDGSLSDWIGRAWEPRNRRATLTWMASAAALVAVVSIVSVTGISRMFGGQRSGGTETREIVMSGGRTKNAAPESSAASAYSSASADMLDTAAPQGYITLVGAVYRSAGVDATVGRQVLKVIGSTTTALVPDTPPTTHDVLGTGDPNRVFIEAADGSLLAFDRVTRSYAGRTYVLQSGAITKPTDGPSLPPTIQRPSNSDGTPSLQPANPDEPAAGVFVVNGTTASAGIVLAPGVDPSVGGDWTFWLPARD
jgi:predicted anti-sigma-YlaC factor YlaD